MRDATIAILKSPSRPILSRDPDLVHDTDNVNYESFAVRPEHLDRQRPRPAEVGRTVGIRRK